MHEHIGWTAPAVPNGYHVIQTYVDRGGHGDTCDHPERPNKYLVLTDIEYKKYNEDRDDDE